MPLAIPTPGKVSSPFGYRWGGRDFHSAIDFAGPIGTPVYATASGTVVNVWANGVLNKYGRVIVIRHEQPSEAPYSLYAHLSTSYVQKGDYVLKGQRIASIGNTAASKEDASRTVPPHLHFELLEKWPPSGRDEDRINPAPLLRVSVPEPSGPSERTVLGLGVVAVLIGVLWVNRWKRTVVAKQLSR